MPDAPFDPSKRFLVALSFPGTKRRFASRVATFLSESVGRDRVFYDAYYEAELARPDLDLYLQEIYGQQSDLVVPFFCKQYDQRQWCNVEWRLMRTILMQRAQAGRLMAVRLDDTPIPGFLRLDGYLDGKHRSARDIADMVLERLHGAGEDGLPRKPPARRHFLLRMAPFAAALVLLLLSLVALVHVFKPLPASTLRGRLVDVKTGKDHERPLPGVKITVLQQRNHRATRTHGVTDDDGFFEIPLPEKIDPGDRLQLLADKEGCKIRFPVSGIYIVHTPGEVIEVQMLPENSLAFWPPELQEALRRVLSEPDLTQAEFQSRRDFLFEIMQQKWKPDI